MIELSNETENIFSALAEFHEKLQPPKNTKQVSMNLKNGRKLSYSYIELPDLCDNLRPQLAAQGLSIFQSPITPNNSLGVQTLVTHKSGEFIKANYEYPSPGNGAQAVGSQITYFRRYALLAALNLGQDDDDGAAASNVPNNSAGKKDLASEAQKKLLMKLMGMQKYNENKVWIETEMTKKQASMKIEELKGE